MKFHTLLTHESPDLDAMMSVLLMQRFGEDKLPGVSSAQVAFASAENLPDGKTPQQLEDEGILALDIGGGRFDTHPVGTDMQEEKRSRSATDLVAEYLGVIYDGDWAPLVEYTRLQDTQGHAIFSKDYLHHLPALHTILLGLDILAEGDSAKKLEYGQQILECIPAYVPHRDKQFNVQELLVSMIERYLFETPPEADVPPEAWENFNKWYERLQFAPKKAFGVHELDDLVSLRAIAIGAFYRFEKDREKVYELIRLCLHAIMKREAKWYLALKDFEELATTTEVEKARISAIESPNGMVIKAARFRSKGDLIIYREPQSGATSILRRAKGPLEHFSLAELAAKVRIAEAVECGENPDFGQLESVGTVNGWFLHQSGNLLIKGSPKAPQFVASKLPLDTLMRLACYQLSDSQPFPLKYAKAYMEYQQHLLKQRFAKS